MRKIQFLSRLIFFTGCFGFCVGLLGCRSPDQGAGKIGPVKKWGVFVGDRVHSTPTVDAQGNIYVGSADHHLYAFNPKGRFLWKYQVKGMVKVWSPTVTADGSVVFGTSDGQLIVLDEDGRLRWEHHPRKKLVGCAPIVTQGLVITTGDLVLLSYDLKTGKNTPLGKKFPPIKGCVSHNPKTDDIYFANHNTFFAWKLKDKSLQPLWNKKMTKTWSLPGFDKQGNLYFGTEDGRILSLNPQGQTRWTYQAPKLQEAKGLYGVKGVFARPVISPQGQVLSVRYGDGIYALSMQGKKLWVFPEGERPFNGYLTVAPDGMIYAGSFDYHLYAITPQGKEHYRFFTNGRIYYGGALSPSGNTLYIGSEDKHFYALHAKKVSAKSR